MNNHAFICTCWLNVCLSNKILPFVREGTCLSYSLLVSGPQKLLAEHVNIKIQYNVSIGDIFYQLSACSLSMLGRKELNNTALILMGGWIWSNNLVRRIWLTLIWLIWPRTMSPYAQVEWMMVPKRKNGPWIPHSFDHHWEVGVHTFH